MAVKNGDKVTDMATGFAGMVVQRREFLSGQTKVLVAPEALPGVALDSPRWIAEPKLRLSKPRHSRGSRKSIQYSHKGQEAITTALLAFANRVLLARVQPGEPVLQLADGKTIVSLNDIADAQEDVLEAVGYVFVDGDAEEIRS